MADIYLNPKLGDLHQNSYVTRNEASQYFATHYNVTAWTNLTATQREQVLVQAAYDLEYLNYKYDKYFDSQPLAFPRNNHIVYDGTASPTSTATRITLRGHNLYSTIYNEIPQNYFQHGTVHIDEGANRGTNRYIASSLATIGGKYGEIIVSSPMPNNVAASDTYLVFKPVDNAIKWAQCEQALHIAENKFYDYGDYTYGGIGYVRTGDLGISFKNPDGSIAGRKISLKSRKLLGRYLRKTIKIGRA